jgi:hypothetical protein
VGEAFPVAARAASFWLAGSPGPSPVPAASPGRSTVGALLLWNKQYGNTLVAKGQAVPKKPSEYRVVGQPIPQKLVADKVYGTLKYVTDARVDGMLHARVVRPPTAGCGPMSVDETSIAGFRAPASCARKTSSRWWRSASGMPCARCEL